MIVDKAHHLLFSGFTIYVNLRVGTINLQMVHESRDVELKHCCVDVSFSLCHQLLDLIDFQSRIEVLREVKSDRVDQLVIEDL